MSLDQGAVQLLLSLAGDALGRDQSCWRRRAACRGEDPELFFPVGSAGPTALAQIAEAKKTCARPDRVGACRAESRAPVRPQGTGARVAGPAGRRAAGTDRGTPLVAGAGTRSGDQRRWRKRQAARS